MKFTLDAGGAQSAGQGIGSLFKAFALGPQVHQQAQMEGMGQMAKIGQANATARYANARAGLDENQLTLQKDLLQTAMLELGLPTNLAPAFKSRLETGSFGPSYEPPIDGNGPTQQAPAGSETLAKLGRSMALMQRMYGSGSNVAQHAEAELKGQQMRQIDDVVANPALAGAISTAQAASSGKPLFNPTGNTGQSVQMMTGEAGPVNAVLAKIFQTGENAENNQRSAAAGASNASSANSYASAGQHRMQTQKINQDISMGSKGVLQQTDQGLLLVDPRTGTARSVVGPDGRAAGKSGGGEEKPLTEGQAKAVAFAARMQASDGVISDLSASGTIKSVPGSRSGYGLGATINAISPSENQRLDQAKRDFINAVLRRESGAVISDGEFSNAELQYFPQVGEGKAVQQQKANNRRISLEGMKADIPKARLKQVDQITQRSGATGQWGETPSSAPAAAINSDAEYDALQSGAVFTAPDGTQRRKP